MDDRYLYSLCAQGLIQFCKFWNLNQFPLDLRGFFLAELLLQAHIFDFFTGLIQYFFWKFSSETQLQPIALHSGQQR